MGETGNTYLRNTTRPKKIIIYVYYIYIFIIIDL